MQRLNVFTIRRKPITPFENARRSVLSALSAARTRRSNFEFPFFQKWQRRPVKAALVTSNLAATTPPAAVALMPLLTLFRVALFAHATTPTPTSSFGLRRVGLPGYPDEHGRRSSAED
jgi:hypothetical protein